MENASKALIMAGGILIGLVIFAMFVYELTTFAGNSRIYDERVAKQQIEEFNSQFEKYTNQSLTAQDIVTINNYIIEWNKNNPEDDVEIVWNNNANAAKNLVNENEKFLTEFKDERFECIINNSYYDEWGRIRTIYIKKT